MSEASGLEMNEQPFRDKLDYETVLGFRKERKQMDPKPEQEPLLN